MKTNNKSRTKNKAVIRKVLASALAWAVLMSSTVTLATAASDSAPYTDGGGIAAQNYGVTAEQVINEIGATIAAINESKTSGTVDGAALEKLEALIYDLGYASNIEWLATNNILDEAELAVKGVAGNTDVLVAVSVIRASISINGKGSAGFYEPQIQTPSQGYDEAAQMVSSFSDVTQDFWYYEPVMKMTQMGYFAGKGDIVNGVGTFMPDDTMSKAEFLTVVARILFGEKTFENTVSDTWWDVYYEALADCSVFSRAIYVKDSMEQPMTRQEMAWIAVSALNKRGEELPPPNTERAEDIPDYNTVDEYYKNYVLRAYIAGILEGTDIYGTFEPYGTLTRAQASTVLYRIIQQTPNGKMIEYTPGPITIIEGQVGKRRFAKEGDTVIKADGTQVVLKKGPHGVLGEGQGVAPDLGVQVEKGGNTIVTAMNITGTTFSGLTLHTDSVGISVLNQSYRVNQITGEGHWAPEWRAITSEPTTEGAFDGQLSPDKNWYWSTDEWLRVYVQNMSEEGIRKIKELNGLS